MKERLDLRRASADSSRVRALEGVAISLSPTDRAKAGNKHYLLVDRKGHPLAVRPTAANSLDVRELLPLVDVVPLVCGRRGWPQRRLGKRHRDEGYASRTNRRGPRERGIISRIAQLSIDSSEWLGRRYQVGGGTALGHSLPIRCLLIRDEHRADIH